MNIIRTLFFSLCSFTCCAQNSLHVAVLKYNGGGDYYAAIGTIKGFQYNIGVNGEFDCTTELTSMGSTLFKGLMDTFLLFSTFL